MQGANHEMVEEAMKSSVRVGARLVSMAALLATAFAVSPAEAQVLRFAKTAAGGIASTGNTLGLAKAQNTNGPGDWDSIGTFISRDPMLTDNKPASATNPWPKGTTWDWTQNGSSGVLTLPAGAEVLYAELVWGGSYKYIDDVTSSLDTAVTLSVGGAYVQVKPDKATAITLAQSSTMGFAANYYLRSAEVTGFVNQHMSATYTTSGVPATQHETFNKLNAAGWTLVVAYRDDKQSFLRNLSVFVGGTFVDENAQQDYTLKGFCAPNAGPVKGNLVVSALEGDANLPGDQLLIAKTAADKFVNLSGPNNPEQNFFASQINGKNGMLDTKGSFGKANHDAMGGKNVTGGRQGWDLTTVSLSADKGQLSNGQKSAVIRTTTTGDSYVPAMVAMELDVKAPVFANSSTTADKNLVDKGDTFAVVAKLANTGEAPANDLIFSLAIEPGLVLKDYRTENKTGDAKGGSVDAKALANGVDAGSLEVQGTRTITMTFEVVGAPKDGAKFVIAPMWDHNFVVCTGDKPINESHTPPSAIVPFKQPLPMGTGGAGGSGGGDSGSGSGVGGGSPSFGPVKSIEEEAGCACSLPGAQTRDQGFIAALMLAAGLMFRRRAPRRR
jgi:hypothetical protein